MATKGAGDSAPATPLGKATLLDVARAAGVSRSTAARSLGGYGRVDPALREKVLEAAKVLGYRANSLARSVSSGRSQTIGVVVSDIENPHFSRAVRGISDVAQEHGMDVILVNTDEKLDLEQAALKTLLDKRVDGLIVAPSTGVAVDHFQEALDMHRPLVLLDRSLPGLTCDWVGADDYSATIDIVGQFVEAGHREVCLVAATTRSAEQIESKQGTPISPIAERIRALRDAAREHCIDYRLFTGAMSQDRTRDVITSAMRGRQTPTALIGSYSEIVLTAVDALRAGGWRIPEDVSVASLDDARWMSVTTPGITAARRPSYEMGARATEVLLRRLADKDMEQERHLLPTEVISRQSIASPTLLTESIGT